MSKKRLDGKELLKVDDTRLSDETDTALDNKTLWRLASGGGQDDNMKELYKVINKFYDEKRQDKQILTMKKNPLQKKIRLKKLQKN